MIFKRASAPGRHADFGIGLDEGRSSGVYHREDGPKYSSIEHLGDFTERIERPTAIRTGRLVRNQLGGFSEETGRERTMHGVKTAVRIIDRVTRNAVGPQTSPTLQLFD